MLINTNSPIVVVREWEIPEITMNRKKAGEKKKVIPSCLSLQGLSYLSLRYFLEQYLGSHFLLFKNIKIEDNSVICSWLPTPISGGHLGGPCTTPLGALKSITLGDQHHSTANKKKEVPPEYLTLRGVSPLFK